MDAQRVENAVRELLLAIGENPEREDLLATPKKVSDSYREFFKGIGADPLEPLTDTFPAESSELVLLKDIELVSICEHHLLPFTGVAHIGYLPSNRLAGLGRLAKVVEIISSRLQLQENLTNEIADAIVAGLDARAVVVVVEARHQCVASRGARQPSVNTVTMAARGEFSDPILRQEVMGLISK